MDTIHRRTMLQGSAALAAAGAGILPNLNATHADAAVTMTGLIDAHCHIFNASDLPIHGFVKQVYYKVYGLQVPQQRAHCPGDEHNPPGSIGRAIAEQAADFCVEATSEAPDAKQELDQLLNGKFEAAADAGMPASDGLARALNKYFTPSGDPAAESGKDAEKRKDRAEFEQRLLKEAQDAGYKRKPRKAGDDSSPFSDPEEAKRIAAAICSGWGHLSTFICWVQRLNAPRWKLAQEIEGIFESKKFALYTPALVDYSKWLLDEPRSKLVDQINVMEQISIRAGKTKFHGYAAFDPLRDIHENGAALQLAKMAVDLKGFIGVKTYPPMGFKAWANANDLSLTFPAHALHDHNNEPITPDALKVRLDASLQSLYSWCDSAQVPILTHATNSYGSGPGYSCRADPSNWTSVIERFPNIRVCLGHFGDFGEALYESKDWKGQFPDGIEKTWEWHFGELTDLNGGKNFVFADVSYYSELLKKITPKHRKSLHDSLVKLLKTFPNASNRLVYGTDYLLLALERNFKEHFDAVHNFMRDVLVEVNPATAPAKLQGIFKDNAATFLGLKAGGQTRARIAAFYQRHNIDASAFLNSF